MNEQEKLILEYEWEQQWDVESIPTLQWEEFFPHWELRSHYENSWELNWAYLYFQTIEPPVKRINIDIEL